MEKEWKNVQTNGRGQEYVKARELSGGIRSSCRAIFFRNTHETTGEKIVSLKIARLNKSNGLLTEKQNKSVTLNSDELDKLIEYIQDYYAPLNIGMKEFISVDEDAAKLFSKIRSLNISDDEVVDKLISTGILTDNLSPSPCPCPIFSSSTSSLSAITPTATASTFWGRTRSCSPNSVRAKIFTTISRSEVLTVRRRFCAVGIFSVLYFRRFDYGS